MKQETKSSSPPRKPTGKNTGTSGYDKNKWGGGRSVVASTPSFKGALPNVGTFIAGTQQAAQYDESYKALLSYFGNHFDHRVHKAFEAKDASMGLGLLTRPVAPKKTIMSSVIDPDDPSEMIEVPTIQIDKDDEDFYEYQHELKKYIENKAKYHENIQKCFTIIIGQCSPDIEQLLTSEETFDSLKEAYDSIGLIKLLEKVCYSYHTHEYTPLGAWESMDKLCTLIQPKGTSEVKHCDKFRSVVEVCKASGVNFALLCTANIDIAIKHLHSNGKISKSGKYSNGVYFNITDNERKLVDKMAEEICLSTRFLALSCDAVHYKSKQELKNDMVKGDNKYPRTMASTLHFLQYHSLRNNNALGEEHRNKVDITLAQGEEEKGEIDKSEDKKPKGEANMVSKRCSKHKDGKCPIQGRTHVEGVPH